MQISRWYVAVAMLLAALLPLAAHAWKRGEVERFATLPAGNSHPEGITADRHGNIYVATIDFGRPGEPGRLFVFDRDGELERTVDIRGATNLLLEIAFQPNTDMLLVVDFGGKQVLRVDPRTGASSVFMTLPSSKREFAGLNNLTFDRAGNVYVSDSFQGIIWRTGPSGGEATPWAEGPLLRTNGVPPFGANGLAFNKASTTLFVTNTGNDQVIKIPVEKPENMTVFVNSVNGPDGLIIDEDDNLWIAANQADEIVVLEPKEGRVIAKLGDFNGINRRGAPRGLLFPVGLVRVGEWLYVTNLSLDLRFFELAPPVDAPWAAQVTRHTVSRIKARIPPVRGLP